MPYSRRDLGILLPALMAMEGSARADDQGILPSKCYPFDALTVKTDPQNHNQTRNVFDGRTHNGTRLDLHITTLAPGQMPHPAHTHVHEEMIFMQEGTLEVTISGQATRIGPGSTAYVKSNDLHGWKNVGDTPAQYFVLAIGKQGAA